MRLLLPQLLLLGVAFICLCTLPSVTALNSLAPLTSKLSVAGTNFEYQGQPIFLNGVNQAWENYGTDFGGTTYPKEALESTLSNVSSAGGNCVRMWLHCGGELGPWITQGPENATIVLAPVDGIIRDLKQYLTAAENNGVFIILSLFNFAAGNNYTRIWTEPALMDLYIQNVLTPILDAISSFNSLGAIELSNEPEGSTAGIPFAGWNSQAMTITDLQRSTNALAHAVHDYTGLLVTQGSWSMAASIDNDTYACTNLYRDDRLIAAGGYNDGILDFQQVHYYLLTPGPSPMKVARPDIFNMYKPFLVGEFSASSLLQPIELIYTSIKNNQYSGTLGWQANGTGKDSDSFQTLLQGVRAAAGVNKTAESTSPIAEF